MNIHAQIDPAFVFEDRKEIGSAPIRAILLRRTLMLYFALAALGALPLLLDLAPGYKSAGIGLWFPGAGFLAAGGWAIIGFPIVLVLVAAGIFLWFAMGAIAVPLAVWVVSAGIAGAMTDGAITSWSPYATGFMVALSGYGWSSLRRNRAALYKRERAERVAYLPEAMASQYARMSAPVEGKRELSEADLQHFRFILDRGLQPIGNFDGFTIIDQFQPAALRYQLSFLQYALAVQQCHFTPNFHGYLSQAQRNLIAKFQDKKVWGYWVYEKLLGHFRVDFDPIGWDNIMLGAFMNMNINMYQGNTGDHRYDQPGSFTFKLNRFKTYVHDAHSINRIAVRNFTQADLGTYPCEPALVYPYCNLLGLGGLPTYDRAHGTSHTPAVRARFRKHLEEDLSRPNFKVATGLCNLSGTEILVFDGVNTDIAFSWLANPHFPDIARRLWAIVKTESLSIVDGELEFKIIGPADKIDLGNYRKSPATVLALAAIAARELGDDEIADAAMRRLDRECPPILENGVLRYDVSTYTQAHIALARILRRDDWSVAINDGPSETARTGPMLTEAQYPAVLVASAVSSGDDLDLVLYSGGGNNRQTLGVERLKPNGRYRIENGVAEDAVADAKGMLRFDVVIDGRTPVRLVPVA